MVPASAERGHTRLKVPTEKLNQAVASKHFLDADVLLLSRAPSRMEKLWLPSPVPVAYN